VIFGKEIVGTRDASGDLIGTGVARSRVPVLCKGRLVDPDMAPTSFRVVSVAGTCTFLTPQRDPFN
jgi:hypothetical protein